ncbi:MAG: TonB-dependent receptor [Methylotenera sp.]|uniref:TonB-dependent receptor domain-containing protein n=1 Tax=Methylotenera sp. TaxID=2051956 RepID=UPI00248899CE|nr:TonB-dependent receptor [Methylotenera sp.]MDI1308179.1 TonB-dependent receptor [Methylotenera sp.]
MKKSTIASLVALAFSPSAFAAETAIQTEDVIVTASRVAQPRESVIADVTVINREEIERAGQSTFIELLQTQPGVEIASSGGAGKISSVFLRGTSATQVIVLIDGIRVGAATTGQTTFENIPLAQIEKIEILRGPASSLYGQDAIGGVIQIFTKKGEGKPHFYAAVGYGSYDTKTAEAGVNGKLNDTRFALNLSSSDSDGFSAKHIKTGAQADDDGYRNLAVSGSLSHQIAEGHEIGVQLLSSEGHSAYDSSNTFKNTIDLSQLSYSLFSKNQFTSNWKSTLRLGEGIDGQDNQFSPTSHGAFKTKQRQYSWQNDIGLPLGTLTLLYDRLEQRIISATNPYKKTDRDTDGFLVGYLADIGDHSVQATLRSDHSSQYGTNNTGGIGYGYKINPNWRTTASYGKAFKAPTFNDLYFAFSGGFPFNNPNLKAEKSENFEASLRYEDNQRDASVTLFQNKINNFIALAPSFLPINVDAKIQGITLAGAQRWDSWELKGSADIQSPHDETNDTTLARRANRHGSLNLNYQWNDWRFGSELVASSLRYNDAANQFKLGGYAVLNLIANYKINSDLSLQGRLNNALDKNYALTSSASIFGVNDPAYNTPGANLFVSVRWEPSAK